MKAPSIWIASNIDCIQWCHWLGGAEVSQLVCTINDLEFVFGTREGLFVRKIFNHPGNILYFLVAHEFRSTFFEQINTMTFCNFLLLLQWYMYIAFNYCNDFVFIKLIIFFWRQHVIAKTQILATANSTLIYRSRLLNCIANLGILILLKNNKINSFQVLHPHFNMLDHVLLVH